MKDKALAQSKAFWSALEKADVSGMQAVADPKCMFVHIGVTCGMEEEMRCFTDKIFIPTKVVLNSQQAQVFGDTAIVITDCNYSLLLGGKETTHHFAITEVYVPEDGECKLVQLSFTALVY